jgi:hypothetical protein
VYIARQLGKPTAKIVPGNIENIVCDIVKSISQNSKVTLLPKLFSVFGISPIAKNNIYSRAL